MQEWSIIQSQIFTIELLTIYKRLNPALPDIRLISKRGLLSISYYWCLQNLRIFQHLCKLVFIHRIFNKCKQILVFAFPVDHSKDAEASMFSTSFNLDNTLLIISVNSSDSSRSSRISSCRYCFIFL